MPRFSVFDLFLSVMMVCWRSDPHAAFHVCIGHKTAFPKQGTAQPAWLTALCCAPLGATVCAQLSATAVTDEVAQEAGHPGTMVQPNSECFLEELGVLRGA